MLLTNTPRSSCQLFWALLIFQVYWLYWLTCSFSLAGGFPQAFVSAFLVCSVKWNKIYKDTVPCNCIVWQDQVHVSGFPQNKCLFKLSFNILSEMTARTETFSYSPPVPCPAGISQRCNEADAHLVYGMLQFGRLQHNPESQQHCGMLTGETTWALTHFHLKHQSSYTAVCLSYGARNGVNERMHMQIHNYTLITCV